MEPIQDQRFSQLLDKQQAGKLTDEERPELLALMQVYQEGLLRKAQALNEAVQRGLRKPLEIVSISDELKERIRRQAGDRCGYCQSAQRYVFGPLEIDHRMPTAHGGTDDEENLRLACRMCNGFKSDHTHGHDPLTGEEVRLFNPRTQKWAEHFAWGENGTQVVGLTPCGRATVVTLQLNNLIAVMVRREWVSAGWHPPK